ncbi:MAG: hypothetical protein MUC28_02010 [Planctomycetes bacterium]|jgi:hypothetical protein|nr:hypothetical protein [Planctomycetota bacterium]
MNLFKKTSKVIVILAGLVLAVSYFQLEKLPSSKAVLPPLLNEPKQTKTNAIPLKLFKDGFSATITPEFAYELSGLVVAAYDSGSWFDYMHKRYDPFNSQDICVVWGDNVKSDLYKKIEFSHGEFTCFYRTKDQAAYRAFNPAQLANNHLVPGNEAVARVIKRVKIGDQVYLAGYLTNNIITNPSGGQTSRTSSVTRADTGNGACEVVYVKDFKILAAGQTAWRLAYRLAKYALLAGVAVFFLIFIRELRPRRQSD